MAEFVPLLTALATVVVAFIGVAAGVAAARVPLKDTREQLIKDAELLAKLD